MHKQKISYFAKKGEIELTLDNVRTVSGCFDGIRSLLEFCVCNFIESSDWGDVSKANR